MNPSLPLLLIIALSAAPTAYPPTAASMAIPGPCEGCTKHSITSNISGNIEVTVDLSIGNGQCNGAAAPCEAIPCPITATAVELTNTSGQTLHWSTSLNPADPRTPVVDGDVVPRSYITSTLACGTTTQVVFWDGSGDDASVVAVWGWECKPCAPTVP